MDQWTQMRFDVLHFSLQEEIAVRNSADMTSIRLNVVKERIKSGWLDGEADLIRCRAAVCDACRGTRLYACDVEAGWSENCAFIKRHSG